MEELEKGRGEDGGGIWITHLAVRRMNGLWVIVHAES